MFKPFANFAFFLIAFKAAYPSSDPISKNVLSFKSGIKFNLNVISPWSPIDFPPDGNLNDPLKLKDRWFAPINAILFFLSLIR